MNKNLEDKYLSVIEDNVNVGKTSELKEFSILIFLYLYSKILTNINSIIK